MKEENKIKVGIVPEILPGTWHAGLNVAKHNFLQPETWEWEEFDDKTDKGLLHVIFSDLTFKRLAPKRKEATCIQGDIECEIDGVHLSVIGICLPSKWYEPVSGYDWKNIIQPDGSIRFIADSAESWFIFYNQFFYQDDDCPEIFE